MKFAWGRFLSRFAQLSLAGVAAGLSATLFRDALIPDQIAWLGSSGTLFCLCLLPICFINQGMLGTKLSRALLSAMLLTSCLVLVGLRLYFVVPVTLNGVERSFLIGSRLTSTGVAAQHSCSSDTDVGLLQCAGVDNIPAMFGRSYTIIRSVYVANYLLLVAMYIGILSSLDLASEEVDSSFATKQ